MAPFVNILGFSLSLLELLGLSTLSGIVSFLVFAYHWSLDARSEKFSEQCKNHMSKSSSFRSIPNRTRKTIVVTSDSNTSKARSLLKRIRGSVSTKPQKIVPMESQSMEERKKEIIFENCKDIPGKLIIRRNLLGCLRNYFCYRYALENNVEDEITLHFKTKFEEYENSNIVQTLASADYFQEISLVPDHRGEKTPLDDVFLPILQGAQDHCVQPVRDRGLKEREIERCRAFMMQLFWRMYSQDMVGIIDDNRLTEGECVGKYRIDVKENDNIGYWLLPNSECGENEFKRFCYIGWKIQEDVLDEYWSKKNYEELYPDGGDIKDMEFVESPFIVFRKKLGEFQEGAQERIHGEPKFRRKEELR